MTLRLFIYYIFTWPGKIFYHREDFGDFVYGYLEVFITVFYLNFHIPIPKAFTIIY